jgi:cell division protein FtsW (lipid II flippase)
VKGRKRIKRRYEKVTGKDKNREDGTSLKTIGTILEALALFIMIIVAVALNVKDKDLGTISLLLLAGNGLFIVGFALSHLPKSKNKEV